MQDFQQFLGASCWVHGEVRSRGRDVAVLLARKFDFCSLLVLLLPPSCHAGSAFICKIRHLTGTEASFLTSSLHFGPRRSKLLAACGWDAWKGFVLGGLRGSDEAESHFTWPFPPWGNSQCPSPVPGCLSVRDLQVLNVFEPSVLLSNLVKIGQRLHKLLGNIARQRLAGKENECISLFR